MPLIKMETSVKCDENKKGEVAKKLSSICAEIIGKPERYVAAVVEDGAAVTFGGELCNGAFVEVKSIGGIGGGINKSLSAEICSCLEGELGISPANVYINFTDVGASNWGCNGSTFG